MARNELTTVELPDGEKVKISNTPLAWWTEQNASGYVSPAILAPDPKNPRQYISKARVDELHESIRARGVRQQLVITPCSLAPWVKLPPKYAHCFFLVVSGHTRQQGALLAHVGAVPVKVSIYRNEKDHRMDASLLNKGQADLTALEEGYEIAELQRLGWKVSEIAESFGMAESLLYLRRNLTQLSPELQTLLDPELARDKRLPATIGGHLGGIKPPLPGELEELMIHFSDFIPDGKLIGARQGEELTPTQRCHALQKLLLQVIKTRKLSSTQAIEFIRDRTIRLTAAVGTAAVKTERYQPKRRKDIIDSMLKGVMGSLVVDWPPQEIRRIFELAPREEVEEYVKRFTEAGEFLAGIVKLFSKLASEKRPSRPEVIQIATHRKQA